MRIVITKNGKFFVKEFKSEEDFTNNDSKPNNNKLRYNNSTSSLVRLPKISTKNSKNSSKDYFTRLLKYRETFHIKNYRSNSIVSKKVLESYFNRDESKININELNIAKKVNLNKSKINISQSLLDKYDLDSTFQKKLENLSKTLRSPNDQQSPDSKSQNEDKKEENEKNDKNEKENIKNNNNISFKNLQSNMINENNSIIDSNIITGNYSLHSFNGSNRKIILGDIISKNNFINLSKDISKNSKGLDDNRVPLDENNIKSYNFRSKYENKQKSAENLDLLLNFPINSDKTNLIKYLNQKKNIAPFYFKNLLKYDEIQMYKLNQICKVLFDKKENEFRESKKKVEKDYNKDKSIKQKSKDDLVSIGKIMKKSNGILDIYLNKIADEERIRKEDYEYTTTKFKEKYWDKYNVDRFLKMKEKIVLHPELFKLPKNLGKTGLNESMKLKANNSSPNIFC